MSNQWYDIDSWQWVDNDDSQWGFSTASSGVVYEGLNHIWTDNLYVYAATTDGLDVIDIDTELRQSFATNLGGYTTVWSDSDFVFVGSSAGIQYFRQSDVGPAEIISALTDYASVPDLTSDEVRYLHGNENKLICCTERGVDVIRRNSGYRTYTNVFGAQKCFITPNHDYIYYTISGIATSGTAPWYIHRLNNNTSNWSSPDLIYATGSGFLENATRLNDFYVTEHTSTSGLNNTLFIATDNGIYVYDEGSGNYIVFTTVS